MLAAMEGSIVVSEAPVLDAAVTLAQERTTMPDAARIAMLRALVGALGRDRHDEDGPFVLKLDSWHSLALPLFRRAFPETPWVFLFRDPLAVMVSQHRMRGLQTVRGAIAALDIADGEAMSAERHTAHVLAKICDAALVHRGLGGGLFVDYARLPDAVENIILPHFGIAADAQQIAAMRIAATRDAKTPAFAFTSDAGQTRSAASRAVRDETDTILIDVHRRLAAAQGGARA